MAGESQKLKLLNLAKMLYERTDESHGLTCPEIIAGLAEAGIEAERKSVYRDLDALRDFGLDIAKLPTYPVSYALVSRTFTAAELMLLTDAVQSSRFLTVRMAHRLTEGLASLGSCHQAAALSTNVHVEGRIKMQNESVFHHVDTLPEAIRRPYCETPVCLIYSEGCYYLIAYNEKHDSFPSYRVDRMQGLRITDEAAVRNERIATFDAAAYTSRTFSMFGGETTPATLLVEESVMSAIIDRFGKDVESAPVDATHARVHVTVAASPVFFGWLAQFGTAVRLEAPSALARQYAEYLRDIADSY